MVLQIRQGGVGNDVVWCGVWGYAIRAAINAFYYMAKGDFSDIGKIDSPNMKQTSHSAQNKCYVLSLILCQPYRGHSYGGDPGFLLNFGQELTHKPTTKANYQQTYISIHSASTHFTTHSRPVFVNPLDISPKLCYNTDSGEHPCKTTIDKNISSKFLYKIYKFYPSIQFLSMSWLYTYYI